MRYVIKIAYDGTEYGGWQIQKNTVTVQQKLEEACFETFGKKTSVTASGRTDSGVHAAGQICHFDAETTIPADKIADVLNAKLPEDIAVIKSAQAPAKFDANRSAKKKTYCYRVYLSPRRNPLKDRYALWIKTPVDITKLNDISGAFEGEHDFKAYCKSGSQVKTTVRKVYSVQVTSQVQTDYTQVEISVCGAGFLYNMVRLIAGTLIKVGSGEWEPCVIPGILAAKDRRVAGPTAPAKGLTLMEIHFQGKSEENH